MKKARKVFVALKMAGTAGQSKLAGIFRYLNERYGERSAWDIVLVRTRHELTPEMVQQALDRGTEGFIMSMPEAEKSVAPLASSDVPTIVMDVRAETLLKRKSNLTFIRNSSDAIGESAADYLMEQGVARTYAFLHSANMEDWSRTRFDAFARRLRDNGLWCEELFDVEAVAKLKRPAAVLAAYDDRAFELLKFLASKRIKVPQDVVVLGVDNDTLLCENAHPRLSSVQPDFEREGYLAAETLDDMMSGVQPAARTLYVGVKNIVGRESTAALSPAGKLVQKAMAFIDRHALEGIGVADVVRHLKCSRRLADLRFRELQKRSILQAITERRLEEVRRRLAETKEKMDVIASACGYAYTNYLKNLFKRRFAMSMSDFRRSVRR